MGHHLKNLNDIYPAYHGTPVSTMSISSLTYDPAHRDQALYDLSLLHIRGDKLFKLDMVAAIYLNGVKQLNVYRRYSSVYEFLLEDNYHTVHFQKDVRVMDSLHHLMGALDDRASIHAYSHKHHGAFIHADDFHFETLRWSEFHGRWQGGSIYIETPQEQWASPVMSPIASHDIACHEVYQESEEAFASPEASPEASPSIPSAPIKQAQAQALADHTPSIRRCLSDRFTALLQKRTFSESESDSEEEESQEDCCTVLRSGMKYPRNLY